MERGDKPLPATTKIPGGVRRFVHRFPDGLRISTLEERHEFYSKELDLGSLTAWIGGRQGTTKLAMIPGRHSGIVAPEHARDKDNVVILDDWRNARDVRRYCLDWLPEGVYYDRNRYRDVSQCAKCGNRKRSCFGCYNHSGQQLAFDLDPENVTCPVHGHLGDRLGRGESLLSFCMIEFSMIRRQAWELSREMRKKYDKVSVVFSGRGFHVVVDDEEGYALTRKERAILAKRLLKRYDIDEWVTIGSSRLLRLPYSLNAIVSRKCMPINVEKMIRGFDPRTSSPVIPAFARSA